MTCEACGQEYPESASFCGGCGVPVPDKPPPLRFCTACGQPLDTGADACGECGELVVQLPTAAAASAVPAKPEVVPPPEPEAEPAPSAAAPGVTVINQIGTPHPQGAVLAADAADKSPGLACFLSLLISGVGQMYNGEVGKGIAMFVGSMLLWTIMLGWIMWIWSPIDAYQVAKRKRTAYQAIMSGAAQAAQVARVGS